MKQNLATLVSFVSDAQRRVRESTRQTPEWRDAQRAAVRARLDYWNAMCLSWDVRHPRGGPDEVPVNGRSHLSASGQERRRRRWIPTPSYRRVAADEALAIRGPSRG
jgi:hypothetical protein